MAYRQWLPNPAQTIGVRMTDDAMHPILPSGLDRGHRSIDDRSRCYCMAGSLRPVPMGRR